VSSDSVQVKFQVLSQSPAHSQLGPFVHLDMQAVGASMKRHSFVRLIESGMAQRGVAIGRATLGYVSEMACPSCTLPLTWLQLRDMETHQRQVCVCVCVCVCVASVPGVCLVAVCVYMFYVCLCVCLCVCVCVCENNSYTHSHTLTLTLNRICTALPQR
jgi:hypothetical protein